MRHIGITLLLLIFCSGVWAQPAPSSAADRLEAFSKRKQLKQNTWLGTLEPRSIGPSVFSCRVTDVDVNPNDPTEFYVAYASGGLWYTQSNGTRFEPVFDDQSSMTIGDVAVDWESNTIWVGTGEVNSSRSSYAGTGIFKSTNGGETWEYKGLPESHHIGRIILHPTDKNTMWVAVLGHLYSPNEERGVYRSTDGGETWSRTLYVHENAGAVDLCLDPNDPQTLYAATWDRERRAWNFRGAGEGSAIWKSTDGGQNWENVSKPGLGFPSGENTGRIGISAGLKDGKTVLYASVDNQNQKPKDEKKKKDGLTKDDLRSISKEAFLELDDDKLGDYLKKNRFPKKYTVSKVKRMVRKDEIDPQALVEYLEDANKDLFETDYIGAEVYRSDDGGLSWVKTHEGFLDGINFTYGYYFSTVYADRNNADRVYLLGFLIIFSEDGGKTWKSINGDNVHVDHHALWVNPDNPGHLINGNDGGLNLSWDNGKSWMKANNPPVGQFYTVAADNAKRYRVYGGTQDNGVWVGPATYKASDRWHQTGQYPYKMIMGGDGMQVQIDTRNNNTVFTGFQFGNYFRINQRTEDRKFITPKHELGERPLRFNWQTPIHLSTHQQDILYFGANKLYRSFNQGDDWECISEDLTAGGEKGNVPYGTLTSIHESPLRFGLLYTGSDDGLVHVSQDGGGNWTDISNGLPEKMWVSRVQASAHEKSRVYLSLNGYRWDDFNSYVYVSEDFGDTWKQIGTDLPAEPVNVIKEDPNNENVLYVGTDHGLYASFDRGAHFHWLGADFPAVPVHDLAVQAREKDLLVGTHGRSLYRVSVNQLEGLTEEILAGGLHLFKVNNTKKGSWWGSKPNWGEANEPESRIWVYSDSEQKGEIKVFFGKAGELHSQEVSLKPGLNSYVYNYEVDPARIKSYEKTLRNTQKKGETPFELKAADNGKYYLAAGSYRLELKVGDKSLEKTFEIE